jgi:hypothetical protein
LSIVYTNYRRTLGLSLRPSFPKALLYRLQSVSCLVSSRAILKLCKLLLDYLNRLLALCTHCLVNVQAAIKLVVLPIKAP